MRAYELWGSEEEVKNDPINSLLGYYVRFHQEDVENPQLDDEARDWFKRLEDGDEEATRLWKWFREESLKAFTDEAALPMLFRSSFVSFFSSINSLLSSSYNVFL